MAFRAPTSLLDSDGEPARIRCSREGTGSAEPAQTAHPWWRDAAVGFSIANLCFIRVWSLLLEVNPEALYSDRFPRVLSAYYICALEVLILGSVLTLATRLALRGERGWERLTSQIAFLAALLFAANALRTTLISDHYAWLRGSYIVRTLGATAAYAMGLVALIAGLFVTFRWGRLVMRAAATVAIVMSPLLASNLAVCCWRIAHYDLRLFLDKPLAPLLQSARADRRIVWVIWDEWDQRLTFQDRLPGLELPNIDRFRRDSFYATRAYPPAGQTMKSIPALLTGQLIASVNVLSPDRLLLTPAAGRPFVFSGTDTILSDVRKAGFNTGLIGFYHPVCRVLNDSVSSCWWQTTSWQGNALGETLPEVLFNIPRTLLETENKSIFGQSLPQIRHSRVCQEAVRRAKELAIDRKFGLVFLHIPIPHPPFLYDRLTGKFTLYDPRNGYWNGLALLDRSLGELRDTIERTGTWDTITILMSSDHWNRKSELLDGKDDHRVPFLLKMAGQRDGLVYDTPFNTVLTRRLLMAVVRGELTDAHGVACWLDANRTIADTPYPEEE